MKPVNKSRFINYFMVLKTIGWLLMIEAFFMAIPTFVCVGYNEDDWVPFALSTAVTLLTGFSMTRLIKPKTSKMSRREGFLLTASVWVVFSLFGMLPLLFSAQPVNITDGFFETMSGFTTTGASVYETTQELSHGIHIWRALMQWIGGMGIILFTLAVLPMLNSSGGMQMFNAEVTGITHDKVRPRISQTAKALWLLYILITAGCATFLFLGPMDLFDAICYSFGTASTGGYSVGDTEYYFSFPEIKLTITVFMFMSAINFALVIRALRSPVKLFKDEVTRIYFLATILFAVILACCVIKHEVYAEALSLENIIDPVFQAVSSFTSTGYALSTLPQWGTFAMAVIMIMIIIGGCAGSTSGGMKIDRVIFLIKYCRNEVYRCVHPNAVTSVRLNNKVMPPAIVQKVAVYFCLFITIGLAGILVLSLTGVSIGDAAYLGIVCLGNSALDIGVSSFGSNYHLLPDLSKWMLAFMMLTGRLEIYTILILLTPAFWRK